MAVAPATKTKRFVFFNIVLEAAFCVGMKTKRPTRKFVYIRETPDILIKNAK